MRNEDIQILARTLNELQTKPTIPAELFDAFQPNMQATYPLGYNTGNPYICAVIRHDGDRLLFLLRDPDGKEYPVARLYRGQSNAD